MPRHLDSAMRAVALGLFDSGGGIPEDRLTWMVDDVDSFLMHAGPRTRFIFYAAMWAIEWLPPVLTKRFRRLSRLPPYDQARFLEHLDSSRFAVLLALPKAVLALIYYEHPDAVRETGYDFGCLLGELPEGVGLVRIEQKTPLEEISR